MKTTTTNTTIKATNTSPEKSILSTNKKFITATTGKVELTNTTDNFNADGYEREAKDLYAKLPKSIKSITTSMSFCHHTGTKLVVGTSFKGSKTLSTYIKSEHPIFCKELPLRTAITIYGESRTTTEKYIAMTAIMVKAGIINTSNCGLHLEAEQVQYLYPAFNELLGVLAQAIRYDNRVAVDSLLVTGETQSDHKRLVTHIKEVAQAIDSATFLAGGTRLVIQDAQTTKQLKLDDELALEKELSSLLNDYSNRQSAKEGSYTKDLNRWTRRTLARSEMTDEQLNSTMKILNTSPDTIPSGTIERMLNTVEESLCYDDEISRRNSAIVLRHLHYKIELQLACLYKAGFLSEVVAEEVENDKAITSYVAKTRASEDEAIANISKHIKKDGESALAKRMRQHGIK